MRLSVDRYILLSLFGLSLFSLFNLFGIKRELVLNQFFFFIFGFIIFFLIIRLRPSFFRINGLVFYLFFIVLLFLTLFIGQTVRGSRRWIDLFFFQFQTSEFFKPFFLIFLANFLAKSNKLTPNRWLISFAIFLVPFVVIFRQPDFATGITYGLLYVALLFFAGFPLRYFFVSTLFFLITTPLTWHFLKDYQKARFISFIKPEEYGQDIAYNLIQAVITTGSGGLFGRGLGLGTQTRFRFLPEYHTDFAFASLTEQFGLVGAMTVLILYGIILYRLMRRAIAHRNNTFNFLFWGGTIFLLSTAIFINMGMNIGLLPIAGITLPLISYGGSSVISTFILLGLAASL